MLASIKFSHKAGEDQLQRVKRLSQRGRDSREHHLIQQHHEVWRREAGRLADLLQLTQYELDEWRSQAVLDVGLGLEEFLHEVLDMEYQLASQRKLLEGDLVRPVRALRRRVKQRGETGTAREMLVREMEGVKEHLSSAWQLLEEEYQLVNESIVAEEEEEEEERVMYGVPNEVLGLSYPSEALKQELVGEIVRMDEYFELKLKQLEEEKKKEMRCATCYCASS